MIIDSQNKFPMLVPRKKCTQRLVKLRAQTWLARLVFYDSALESPMSCKHIRHWLCTMTICFTFVNLRFAQHEHEIMHLLNVIAVCLVNHQT